MRELISSLAIASLFGIGLGAAFAPETLAANYGIPIVRGDAAMRSYVRALGARDATIGAVALAFALRGNRAGVRTTLGLTTLLAAADLTIVARHSGPVPNLALHGGGLAVMLLVAVLG